MAVPTATVDQRKAFLSSFIGAAAVGAYWSNWAIWFLSHVLAFLTITPAVLYWVSSRPVWTRASPQKWQEATALAVALILLGCVVFLVPWRPAPPAVLYSFVPFLLWAALRFGAAGVSSSMIIISFLAIWGAVHGRGPFLSPDPLRSVVAAAILDLRGDSLDISRGSSGGARRSPRGSFPRHYRAKAG